jgi:hypothetical protein
VLGDEAVELLRTPLMEREAVVDQCPVVCDRLAVAR